MSGRSTSIEIAAIVFSASRIFGALTGIRWNGALNCGSVNYTSPNHTSICFELETFYFLLDIESAWTAQTPKRKSSTVWEPQQRTEQSSPAVDTGNAGPLVCKYYMALMKKKMSSSISEMTMYLILIYAKPPATTNA